MALDDKFVVSIYITFRVYKWPLQKLWLVPEMTTH